MGYDTLIQRINGRRAVVDANLPRIMVDRLQARGVEATAFPYNWSDEKITATMGPNDVLLTRDVAFIRKIGRSRAIHCPKQGHKPKITQEVRWHLKKQVKAEQEHGVTEFKIKRGMRLLFNRKRKVRDWTVWEPI